MRISDWSSDGCSSDLLSNIEIGRNAMILAPSGDVTIGATPGPDAITTTSLSPGPQPRVFIDSGAVIDVGGAKDVAVSASRNSIRIAPVKRNELRDWPDYQDRFLNGATVFVAPRLSGAIGRAACGERVCQ